MTTDTGNVLYTAQTHTTGGRQGESYQLRRQP